MDFLKRWKEKDIEGWRAYVRRANEKAVAKRTPEAEVKNLLVLLLETTLQDASVIIDTYG